MSDQAPVSIIPEKEFARFDELMRKLRTAWQTSPDAPRQLLELASIVLPGASVLSDKKIRETALENVAIDRDNRRVIMKLKGNLSDHTEFFVEFGTQPNENDFLSLQRKAGDQILQLSLSFHGHEFQGAAIQNLGIDSNGLNRVHYITRGGLLHRKDNSDSFSHEGRRVDLDKMVNLLVNDSAPEVPLSLDTFFEEALIPSSPDIH